MASKLGQMNQMIESHPVVTIVAGIVIIIAGWLMCEHIEGLLPLILACAIVGGGIGAVGGGIRSLVRSEKKNGGGA